MTRCSTRLANDPAVAKVSLRDIAPVLARRGLGATTVAATVEIAARAGIAVMATGGIGGVHRGAERSFDESADLEAIARNPVCVVCAGAKLVLDLPLTLERLETLGVPVVGYGTDELPAFYVRSSGLPLAHRVDDALAAARVMREQLARGAGIVIAVPIDATRRARPPRRRSAGESRARGRRAAGCPRRRAHSVPARTAERRDRRTQPRGKSVAAARECARRVADRARARDLGQRSLFTH